jgi:hypothetical protein
LICIHFSIGQYEHNLQKRNSPLQQTREGMTGHFSEQDRKDNKRRLCSRNKKSKFRIEPSVADSKTTPLAKIRPDLLQLVPGEGI